MIGRTIGHFEITAELGRGGMGAVYRARDTRLDRDVALKFLAPQLTANPEARSRFIHEAKAASSLQHPSICTIHEIGETGDGQTYLVMPCYEGETLESRLARGPLAVDEATTIFRQVAQGLEAAHAKGIVHRDIKPANIFLTEAGQAVILDFGVAKLAGQTQLTQDGTTLGTVAYMAPEQASGQVATPASDHWSLGVVFYEALTGHPPFPGEHPQAIIYAISNLDPAPISDQVEDLDPAVARLITACLTKEPDGRSEAVKGWLAVDGGPSSRFDRPSRTQNRPIWLAVPLAILVLLGILWQQGMLRSGGPPDIEDANLIAVMPFTYRGNPDYDYLGEGMMDLLATNLDGVAGASTLDPANLTGAIHRMGISFRNDLASDVARELGCRRYLSGTVTEAGGKLRVLAQLSELQGEAPPIRAEAEGPANDLFSLVDRLSSQLLVKAEESSTEVFELAALTQTTDLKVLKAYLDGEREYRNLHLDNFNPEVPRAAYQRAVDLDSTFALGWYGLAKIATYDIANYHENVRTLVEKAYSLRQGLPDRIRRTLEARYAVYVEGDFDRSEQLNRQILQDYPDDLTASFDLVQTLWISADLRGRDWHEVLPFCRRYHELVPGKDYGPGWLVSFILRFAAVEKGDWEKVDNLGFSDDSGLHLHIQRAFLQGDPDRLAQVRGQMFQASPFWLHIGSYFLIAPDFRPDAVHEVVSILTEPRQSRLTRARGHLDLALLEAGRGRWQSALGQLESASQLHPEAATAYHGWLLGQDFVRASAEELSGLRSKLEAWSVAKKWSDPGNPGFEYEDGYHRLRKWYLLGLLGLKQGDHPWALECAARLDTVTTDKDTGTAATDLAAGIRARVARAEGRLAEALEIMKTLHRHVPYGLHWHNPILNQPSERLLLADLLHENGHPEQALRWYRSLYIEGFSFFHAQGRLGLARAHAALGQYGEAEAHLAKFREIMTGCDPEYEVYLAAANELEATFPG